MNLKLIETREGKIPTDQIRPFNHIIHDEIRSPFTNARVLFGTNPDGEDVVLKLTASRQGAHKEWDGSKRVFAAGVPAAEPLYLVSTLKGNVAVVTRKIDGDNLYLHTSQQTLFEELGKTVKKMHNSTQVDGEEWVRSGRSDFSLFDRFLDKFAKSEWGGQIDKDKTASLFGNFVDLAGDTFPKAQPVFNHHDLHDDQILVTKTGQLFVIDFENWIESHPLHDISMYVFHSLRTKRPREQIVQFLQAYSENNSYTEADRSIVAFLLLYIGVGCVEFYRRYRKNEVKYATEYMSRVFDYIEAGTLWKEMV